MRARLLPCAIAIALAPTLAFTDDYAEFRVPDHAATTWDLQFGSSATRSVHNFETSWYRNSSAGAALSTSASYWFDGDRRSSWLSGQLGQAASMHSTNARIVDELFPGTAVIDRHQWSLDVEETWSLEANERRWIGPGPIAWSARLAVTGVYEQARNNSETPEVRTEPSGVTRIVDEMERRSFENRHDVQGTIGIGVGRVRDVTAVHAAHVIEARLRETGAITRALSTRARLRLAELVVSASALERVEDRPATSAWTAIEDVLRGDGALSERGLSGIAVLRAGEPFGAGNPVGFARLPSMPIVRQRGAWIGAVAGGEHQRAIGHSDVQSLRELYLDGSLVSSSRNNSSSRVVTSQDLATAGVEAAWYRPVGDRWQWSATAAASTSLRNETPMRRMNEALNVDYLVTERWVASGSLGHSRRIADVGDEQFIGSSSWNVLLQGRVSWYLRNRLVLSMAAADRQSSQREWTEAGSGGGHWYWRDANVFVSMTYRLGSGIHAPGFPALEAAGGRSPQL